MYKKKQTEENIVDTQEQVNTEVAKAYRHLKIKLIFSTETKDTECWIDLPFIPRANEWVNAPDMLKEEDFDTILQSAQCWSGSHGIVQSVEYRRDNSEFYVELCIWCED